MGDYRWQAIASYDGGFPKSALTASGSIAAKIIASLMNNATGHAPVAFNKRLAEVWRRIDAACRACGRQRREITLLAVSKAHGEDAVRAALACGHLAFGESYWQDAQPKLNALATVTPRPAWHFIGPLQSNKTRPIATQFDWVQSVDREKIAHRLNDQRPADQPPLNICLQINISGEAGKSGAAPDDLPALAQQTAALPGLRLRGVMAIPAQSHDHDRQRRAFAAIRRQYQRLQALGFDLDTLSMGMSGDLETAILEGSTLVRVGTDLFGPRAAATPRTSPTPPHPSEPI